jgi:hypothetical protein
MTGENRGTRGKLIPVSLFAPQIPNALVWDQNRASAARPPEA